MKNFYLFVCVLALLSVSACKSARKAYERGDYKEAMFFALDKLKSSPGNKKAVETVQKAYPSMLEYYQERISRASQTSDPLKWDKVLNDYIVLNEVYDEIQLTPAAKSILPNAKYFGREYNEALERTLALRYDLGVEALDRDTRSSAIDAYNHFLRVYDLRPDYRDVREKLEYSREAATLYVKIAPLNINSKRYQLSSDFFMSKMSEYLMEESLSPFIQFIKPEESRVDIPQTDHTLSMSFEDFLVGQSHIREFQADRLKDSVELKKTEIKDSTITVYGKVEARLFGYEKEISSSGILNVKIIDNNNRQLLMEKEFAGSFVWYDYWGYYEGDKRALDEEDFRYLDKRRPALEPDPQTLFVEFTRPIYDQATSELRRFYERY